MSKSSMNSELHPYLRGHTFWSKNTFWRDPSRMFSEESKRYFEKWLEDLKVKERSLIRLA